jgi:hypothetical protein
MLGRQGPGHPPVGQVRADRRLPAGLQPLSGRRGPAVGLLQPGPVGLGAGVLRCPTRPWQDSPHRPARTRQPLAGDPVALPAPRHLLRRGHPRRQPQPRPWQSRLTATLTEGVSSPRQPVGALLHSCRGGRRRNSNHDDRPPLPPHGPRAGRSLLWPRRGSRTWPSPTGSSSPSGRSRPIPNRSSGSWDSRQIPAPTGEYSPCWPSSARQSHEASLGLTSPVFRS